MVATTPGFQIIDRETAAMPYVNIKITREGATREQKAALIAGVTDVLVTVLGKDPDATFVVIDEVELGNWGVGGLSVDEYRKKLSGS
jgi:4-oxalocrotonate tautomerase